MATETTIRTTVSTPPETPEQTVKGATSVTLRSIVNDRFCAMTLSRNPKWWQSLPAEKQNELETSPEFITIEAELEALSLGSTNDSTARDCLKKLRAQKKLVLDELRKFQKLQRQKLSSKADKSNLTSHHRTRYTRICGLIPIRRRLASDLFDAVSIRSAKNWEVLVDMIELYQQETEVAFRLGLEPENCQCAAERSRKIDSVQELNKIKGSLSYSLS